MPSSPEQTSLGKRISFLRTQRGLAKKDLAAALNLDPSAATRIENGSRRVSSMELARIADYLGVSVLALLEPESPLAKVSLAARTLITESADIAELARRANSLAELHLVLADAGITATEASPDVPRVNATDWREDAPRLAAWALSELALGDRQQGESLFPSLADRIESRLVVDVLVEPHDGASAGLTMSMDGFCLVAVNSSRPRHQQVFTLAHELSHVLTRSGEPLRIEEPYSAGKLKPRPTPAEKFANVFAAHLLMPEERVRALMPTDGITPEALFDMYELFQVSTSALVYRLSDLGLISQRQKQELVQLSPELLVSAYGVNPNRLLASAPSPSNAYRPPGILTSRALQGFLQGVIGVRPYADLIKADPDELLDELRHPVDASVFSHRLTEVASV